MLDILCIILLVTLILMLFIGIVCDISSDHYWLVINTISTITVLPIILLFVDKSNPTAMDVYQGRTTLEITYKDGIAIDSVVVFKERN